MNYADLARGIYTPYFSGEDYQYGNYPTPMTPKKNQEDNYTQLASNLYLPFMQGMSGDEIQKMMEAYQQAQPVATQGETVTPSTGYGGATLGTTSRGGGGSTSNPTFKNIVGQVGDIGKQLLGMSGMKIKNPISGEVEPYGSSLGGIAPDVTAPVGTAGAAGMTGMIESGYSPGFFDPIGSMGAMFAGESQGTIQSYINMLSTFSGPLAIPINILGGFVQGIFNSAKNTYASPEGLKYSTGMMKQYANPLNYFLSQQEGATPVENPWSMGNYQGRSWENALLQSPEGRQAMNFETYPYIPSGGLQAYTYDDLGNITGTTPEYSSLKKQLEEYNLANQNSMLEPLWEQAYSWGDTGASSVLTGNLLGLQRIPAINWNSNSGEWVDPGIRGMPLGSA